MTLETLKKTNVTQHKSTTTCRSLAELREVGGGKGAQRIGRKARGGRRFLLVGAR
jgi:hypothetical protein